MISNIIVMPGPAAINLEAVNTVARSFGWTVDIAHDIRNVIAAQSQQNTAALLFHRDAFPSCSWLDAVRLLRSTLPEVRTVACHGFSEPFDWPELSEAGAFHALWLPFKENEVQQSFGFIREAEKRLAESSEKVPLLVPATVPAMDLTALQRIHSDQSRVAATDAIAANRVLRSTV